MKKKTKLLKAIPSFKSEEDERMFWETHDSVDYVNWENSKKEVFPELKPSTQSISIRLPSSLLEEIKVKANKRDVPYQSYIKMLLAEALKKAS
jgi:predicted DNA binding CopG/RHH family protein